MGSVQPRCRSIFTATHAHGKYFVPPPQMTIPRPRNRRAGHAGLLATALSKSRRRAAIWRGEKPLMVAGGAVGKTGVQSLSAASRTFAASPSVR